jgi:hypothetical protein
MEDGFVELFIYTHTFHFSPESFRNMLAAAGLAITFENTENSDGEIQVVVTPDKESVRDNSTDIVEAAASRRFMGSYQKSLHSNRQLLRRRVTALKRALGGSRAVFWGGGRIFDAIVKIGGLDASQVSCVVDKFLHTYLSEVHEIPVRSPASLVSVDKGTPILICSDGYNDEIRNEAIRLGFNTLWHYTDFNE